MRIFTRLEYHWNNGNYVLDNSESFEYNGKIAVLCGASAAQNATAQAQSNFYNQLTSQATQVFGNDSQVFSGLMSTFAPIVAAGPSQQGFSPQELSNLNSEAITQTGTSYKNAKEALGNQEAAQGGGTVALPSGANVGANLSLAESGANQTASELGQITQANYAQGNANYQNAVKGEESATDVFNSSTNSANSATGAGTAAANTENQITQDNNSWVNATIGALGSVAGAAVGDFNFGGSGAPSPTPQAPVYESGYGDV